MRAVKLASPGSSSKSIMHNPVLDQALVEAKAMNEKYGVASKEARLAWEAVEQIASNDSTEATKRAISTDDECLLEMIETCEALDELNRALFLKERKYVWSLDRT